MKQQKFSLQIYVGEYLFRFSKWLMLRNATT